MLEESERLPGLLLLLLARSTCTRRLHHQRPGSGRALSLQCLHRMVSLPSRTDLQDMHMSRFLANFMMPPSAKLGVDSVMLLVWSPAAAACVVLQSVSQ